MKKKLFAAIAAGAMLCGMLTAPVSAAETYKKGDVNMDGIVDVQDAQRVLIAYLEFLTGNGCTFTPEQIELCSITKSTTSDPRGNTVAFDVGDAQVLLAYSVDRIAQIPGTDEVIEYYEQVYKSRWGYK